VRDDDDFRDFVRTRGAALSRAAYLLTGDHHLAEDLLQTVLATTYQHWPRIRHGNPDAYVRRALHNTHISWWRRRGVDTTPLDAALFDVGGIGTRRIGTGGMGAGRSDAAPLDAAARLAGSGDGTEATLRRLTVVAALRTLTPRQRAVVVLRYFEDLTEAQAAELLGCTVGTVKRLHFDALARLRAVAPYLIADTEPTGTEHEGSSSGDSSSGDISNEDGVSGEVVRP
jgi:RNA polymerase sigma factor (sigma-70 family)